MTATRERAAPSNLFDAADVAAIKSRVGRLRPDSPRQWGTMNVAQAVAHCAASLQTAVGDEKPPRMLIGRFIGRFVKPRALAAPALRRNTPTSPDLKVTDARDLAAERQRLNALIDRFAAAGPAGCTSHPHTFFGPMTPDEWAVLMHKHIDHHLRQFGA